MTDKNAEMSLDEVLSSIKKMVIDEEPPVLELTDMIAPDGSIVNVKKKDNDEKKIDMSSFLKLIQENTDNRVDNSETKWKKIDPYSKLENINISLATDDSESETFVGHAASQNRLSNSEKDAIISDFMKELISPLIQQWMKTHLPSIVSKAVEQEIKKLLNRSQ